MEAEVLQNDIIDLLESYAVMLNLSSDFTYSTILQTSLFYGYEIFTIKKQDKYKRIWPFIDLHLNGENSSRISINFYMKPPGRINDIHDVKTIEMLKEAKKLKTLNIRKYVKVPSDYRNSIEKYCFWIDFNNYEELRNFIAKYLLHH